MGNCAGCCEEPRKSDEFVIEKGMPKKGEEFFSLGSDSPDKGIVVIDGGSGVLRAGFAGQLAPAFVCPNIIAREGESCHIGADAYRVRDI